LTKSNPVYRERGRTFDRELNDTVCHVPYGIWHSIPYFIPPLPIGLKSSGLYF